MKKCFIAVLAVLICNTLTYAATFTVTSVEDSTGNTYTLRGAIDASVDGNSIDFNTPGGNSITVFGPLVINHSLTIDGGGSQVVGGPGSSYTNLFVVYGNNVTIQNLSLVSSACAIVLNGNTAQILRCRIGAAWDELPGRGNQNGIEIYGDNNYIGSSFSADRNIISGNLGTGIGIYDADNTSMKSNYIGLKSDGQTQLANDVGVYLLGNSSGTVIGGVLAVDGGYNVISGNTNHGVSVSNLSGLNNSIHGNIIGLNNAQNANLPNRIGIRVSAGNGMIIGKELFPNVISGNTDAGIELMSAAGNTVQGNYLGVNSSGTKYANQTGIEMSGASNNYIGGLKTSGSFYNVISGNTLYGINIAGGSNNNIICGNRVGLDPSGSAAIANGVGVNFLGSSNGNLVGSNDPAYGNLIGGNTYGIHCYNSVGGNTIAGNWIGVNRAGDDCIPNNAGIYFESNGGNFLIGGANANAGNYFCGNNNAINAWSSSGNTLAGNKIGILPNGAKPAQTFNNAIYWGGDSHHNSFGLLGGEGNLITNGSAGIQFGSSAPYAVSMYGNTICGVGDNGIVLNGGNGNKAAPQILEAGCNLIRGTCEAGDYVEVFLSDRTSGNGGSLWLLGSVVATGENWEIVPSGPGLVAGKYVTALGTNAGKNTSAFSLNVLLSAAISTSTPTFTPTATPTLSPTPTFSSTATPTPTCTVTKTITMTSTCSPTYTVTPTLTSTPIATSTRTPSATRTPVLIDWQGDQVKAFPNPAKQNMTFAVRLDNPGRLVISIFNLSGERISRLQEDVSADVVLIPWVCKDIAPGIYLVQVTLDNKEIQKGRIAIVR